MTFISQSINIWKRMQQETSWSQCHVRIGWCVLGAVTAELEFLGNVNKLYLLIKLKSMIGNCQFINKMNVSFEA